MPEIPQESLPQNPHSSSTLSTPRVDGGLEAVRQRTQEVLYTDRPSFSLLGRADYPFGEDPDAVLQESIDIQTSPGLQMMRHHGIGQFLENVRDDQRVVLARAFRKLIPTEPRDLFGPQLFIGSLFRRNHSPNVGNLLKSHTLGFLETYQNFAPVVKLLNFPVDKEKTFEQNIQSLTIKRLTYWKEGVLSSREAEYFSLRLRTAILHADSIQELLKSLYPDLDLEVWIDKPDKSLYFAPIAQLAQQAGEMIDGEEMKTLLSWFARAIYGFTTEQWEAQEILHKGQKFSMFEIIKGIARSLSPAPFQEIGVIFDQEKIWRFLARPVNGLDAAELSEFADALSGWVSLQRDIRLTAVAHLLEEVGFPLELTHQLSLSEMKDPKDFLRQYSSLANGMLTMLYTDENGVPYIAGYSELSKKS